MTINELIERLEDYRDELGGDAEVRLMTQSNWPFENDIFGLASGAEINDEGDDDLNDDGDVERGQSVSRQIRLSVLQSGLVRVGCRLNQGC